MSSTKAATKTTTTKTTAATPAHAAQAHVVAPALPVDQWHGVGGEYVIEDGVRRRVGGPVLPADTPAADAT